MTNTAHVLREILLANELGGDLALAYRFSDPDGVRTGKSGWSFGVSQYDLSNNPRAAGCLAEIGFDSNEIKQLIAQTYADMRGANTRLRQYSTVVDTWDGWQFNHIITWVSNIVAANRTELRDETRFHLFDYHNQFYMSANGKMMSFLRSLGRPVTPEDTLDFKLRLPWGQKRPDDVRRRFDNIVRICRRTAPPPIM